MRWELESGVIFFCLQFERRERKRERKEEVEVFSSSSRLLSRSFARSLSLPFSWRNRNLEGGEERGGFFASLLFALLALRARSKEEVLYFFARFQSRLRASLSPARRGREVNLSLASVALARFAQLARRKKRRVNFVARCALARRKKR